MPVTIKTAPHPARKWARTDAATSPEELLKKSCVNEYSKFKTAVQSSFDKFNPEPQLYPSQNGFVLAAVAAYTQHHHFTIRPEDVWFAILSQLSMHINKHAEELREFFVAHKGKKELVIRAVGNIRSVDFGALAKSMSDLIALNVVDPELHPWIMPAFSTTTETDQVVASVIMMGALQKYFSYGFELMCGIPSVTLLGVREDWQEILRRLEKLPLLGAEPAQFYNLLKPILTRFVGSFDAPDAQEIIDFWQKIADRRSFGSGTSFLSGWITAFSFWKENGNSLYYPSSELNQSHSFRRSDAGCCLDNTLYHLVNINDIPSGYASVPVTVNDNGLEYHTVMVAGSVGIRVTSTGEALDDTDIYAYRGPIISDSLGAPVPVENDPSAPQGNPGPDSLQPESGWWMFETTEKPKGDEGKTVAINSDPSSSRDISTQMKIGRETMAQLSPIKRITRRLMSPWFSTKA